MTIERMIRVAITHDFKGYLCPAVICSGSTRCELTTVEGNLHLVPDEGSMQLEISNEYWKVVIDISEDDVEMSITGTRGSQYSTLIVNGKERAVLMHDIDYIHCLQPTVQALAIDNKTMRTLPDLHHLQELTYLTIQRARNLTDIDSIAQMKQLRTLIFFYCKKLKDISPLEKLTGLKTLILSNSRSLSDISPLGALTSLEELDLRYCRNVSDIEVLANLNNLEKLNLDYCGSRLVEKPYYLNEQNDQVMTLISILPLKNLKQLKILKLRGCEQLNTLDCLSKLKQLTELDISLCVCLNECTVANFPKLERLVIKGCRETSLITLSDLPVLREVSLATALNLQKLIINRATQIESLDLSRCAQLDNIRMLSQLTQLSDLNISDCTNLELLFGCPRTVKCLDCRATPLITNPSFMPAKTDVLESDFDKETLCTYFRIIKKHGYEEGQVKYQEHLDFQ